MLSFRALKIVPPASEIIIGLTQTANTWGAVAVAWHAAIGASLIALAVGWRPTQRQACMLLLLPLASVSIFAWLAGNPFNTTLFAAGAVALGVIGARLGAPDMPRPARAAAGAGIAMLAFGWLYPHFLENGSAPPALPLRCSSSP